MGRTGNIADAQSCNVLKRLGAVPYWRGEEKCVTALENIYKKAMARAKEALNREDLRTRKTAT